MEVSGEASPTRVIALTPDSYAFSKTRRTSVAAHVSARSAPRPIATHLVAPGSVSAEERVGRYVDVCV